MSEQVEVIEAMTQTELLELIETIRDLAWNSDIDEYESIMRQIQNLVGCPFDEDFSPEDDEDEYELEDDSLLYDDEDFENNEDNED